MNQMEESARSEHWALQGIYWITKLRTNHTHRVYQKIRGRKAFLYKRGKDWIVGYDTGEGKNTDDNGKMSYIIPGKKILKRGAFKGFSNSLFIFIDIFQIIIMLQNSSEHV